MPVRNGVLTAKLIPPISILTAALRSTSSDAISSKQAAAKALPKAAKMSKKDAKAMRTVKAIEKPAAKKR